MKNKSNSKSWLIIVSGPTAVGKTKTAIDLAQYYNTSILSADSRQVYKEITIANAKPSKKELESVPHHFIDHISIQDEFSAGQFEKEAIQKLTALFKKKNIVIAAGGTNLYIKAICEGFDDIPAIDLSIRNKVIEDFEKKGLAYLKEEAFNVDPSAFKKTDIENPKRLMRILEVYRATGKTLSSFQILTPKPRAFNIIKIGLSMDRAILYQRINKRVDIMIENGLLEEAKSLYPFKQLNALQTVGLSELFSFFDGEISKERAIELIKRNSRRYAKRQLTWLRGDKDIKWFSANENTTQIKEYIDSTIS